MDKTLRNVIIGVLCVMAFSVFYYFVVFLPSEKRAERSEIQKKEQTAKEEAAAKETQKRSNYDMCISAAARFYLVNWEGECGRLNRGENCALPKTLADSIENSYKDEKDRCYKVHLQN